MSDKPFLFSDDVAEQGRNRHSEICRLARIRCFGEFRGGEDGVPLLRGLRQYMTVLQSQIRRRFSLHSKYFLLHHFRRLRVPFQLALGEMLNWQQDDYEDFKRETLGLSWLYARITLSALKYGSTNSKDMQTLSPYIKGTTGYPIPNQLPDPDAIDLLTALLLMIEYEEAKYCLKRAGKGGEFKWADRERLEYDVVLATSLRKLTEIFDCRAGNSGNILCFSGTWALTESGDDFPLPNGEFTVVNPWPRQVVLRSRLSVDAPIVLTLVDNIAGQGQHLGWRIPGTRELLEIPPPWLFQWLRLESMLPRIELFRGVMKKHLELSGRPAYEPEDLIMAICAITRYQVKSCLRDDSLWFQIFSYGYSVWSEPYELLVNRILPEFQHLREQYTGISPSHRDWDRLTSVIEDIKWDEAKYRQIDILRFSPINLISPIDENTWLVDWTLMLHLFFNLSSAYGRMLGTVAMLRGKDLQIVIGNYLESNARSLGITVWWFGHRTGKIRFRKRDWRDVDIGIIVDDHLLIVEIKAHAASRDLLIIGEPNKLKRRWEDVIVKDFDQVDTLSERLLNSPRGENYEIPDSVKWIVPVVCSPFPEWVPSPEKKWWLYEDIPKVLTPDELLETIARIRSGDFPTYRLPLSTP